jgi:hypothetical protein
VSIRLSRRSALRPGASGPPLGESWTLQNHAPALDQAWWKVAWGNGQFVAVAQSFGPNNTVMTSPDGITWTSRNAAISRQLNQIHYANGLWVATGYNWDAPPMVMTSTDAITWTSRSEPDGGSSNVSWNGLAYGNGKWVATASAGSGTNTQLGMTSPDGVTWTLRSIGASIDDWGEVVWAPELSLFVTVGNKGSDGNAVAATSPDGITWTVRTTTLGITTGTVASLAWSGSLFVAVYRSSSATAIMTSPDGITWTGRDKGSTSVAYDVCWAGDKFVIPLASPTDTTKAILTSPDGITWTQQITPGGDRDWYGIAYNGTDKLVAVGGTGVGGRVMTSP